MEVINLKGRNQEEVYKAIAAGELSYIGDHQNQGGWKLKRTKWYNPYKIDKPGKKRDGTRAEVLEKYWHYILNKPELLSALPELNGKVLGCWCKPLPCHGDILAPLVWQMSRGEAPILKRRELDKYLKKTGKTMGELTPEEQDRFLEYKQPLSR